ncbi:MAG: 8-amino-7-oxononanoate synthase [Acidiferrobacteraceae bacterium]
MLRFKEQLAADLRQREAQHLYRRRRVMAAPQQVERFQDGRRQLSFGSNDYLGFASHPKVVAAIAEGARRYGAGTGASHLVTGHMPVHEALEEALAAFVGRPRALLFSSGYLANLGLIQALADRHSAIFEDRLNHASLLDATRLTRARVHRIPHRDTHRLRHQMLAADPGGTRLVVTDGVFSMEGDLADLQALDRLCADTGALLVVDDAHGLGVIGATGRGTFEQLGVGAAPHSVVMGTLGKAFGVSGAFVAGDEVIIETLIQRARTYIYTTAQPPALAHALLTSLALMEQEAWRRARLRAHIDLFREGARALGIPLRPSETPIQPVILGDSERVLTVASRLEEQGFFVPAIRPPTVPAGSARLRVTLSAAHESWHVEQLLDALGRLCR